MTIASPLTQIPGVGKSIAKDLESMGIREVADLKQRDAEQLYEQLEIQAGAHVDRCMLYVFREAIYFANGGRAAEKLKWWNWKDGTMKEAK
jgi:predicted RecB family nuclease